MRIDLDNGKYTYEFDEATGASQVLRYGEIWKQTTGDDFLLSFAHRVQDLEKQLAIAAGIVEQQAIQFERQEKALRDQLRAAERDATKVTPTAVFGVPFEEIAVVVSALQANTGKPAGVVLHDYAVAREENSRWQYRLQRAEKHLEDFGGQLTAAGNALTRAGEKSQIVFDLGREPVEAPGDVLPEDSTGE